MATSKELIEKYSSIWCSKFRDYMREQIKSENCGKVELEKYTEVLELSEDEDLIDEMYLWDDLIFAMEDGMEFGWFGDDDREYCGVRLSVKLDIMVKYNVFEDETEYVTCDYIMIDAYSKKIYVQGSYDGKDCGLYIGYLRNDDKEKVLKTIEEMDLTAIHKDEDLHKTTKHKPMYEELPTISYDSPYCRAKAQAQEYANRTHTYIKYETDKHIYMSDGHSFRFD